MSRVSGRQVAAALTLLLAAVGLFHLGGGAWIYAKAALAKTLIADAWDETLKGGVNIRPWPWADTWPVAKLDFPTRGKQTTVLAGANGATLAFGPGHLDGTAAPGNPGMTLIAGHRDTSFTLLGDLTLDDPVRLQTADGGWQDYRVTGTAVVDASNPWTPQSFEPGGSMLTLMTCWPLDAIVAGGPMRYLVFAERERRADIRLSAR